MNETLTRCGWVTEDPLYIDYHDQEWGVPAYDDQVLFEFLLLESMQAGLSWITILKRRENYRRLFDQFDPARVARYTPRKVEKLVNDASIIRHRGKILAAIHNAQCFVTLQEKHGSFANFLWHYVEHKPVKNHWHTLAEVPATTPLSEKISKEFKKLGFKFFGPTICYAYLQAVGVVDDHTTDCFRY